MARRRSQWWWWFVGAVSCAGVACASFSGGPADDGANGPDATAPDADGPDGTGPSGDPDAADANDANPCTELVADSFDVETRTWVVLGDASIDTTRGEAILAPFLNSQSGAIWVKVDPAAQSFHASFQYLLRFDDPEHGDGITVAWLPDTATPPLGGYGGALGLCGGSRDALALALWTYTNSFALVDTADGGCSRPDPKPMLYAAENRVVVDFDSDAGSVNATIVSEAGQSTYQALVPRTFPIHWIGFTGGNGGSRTEHAVDDVRITVCR